MNSDGLYPINQKYQFITILDRNIPYDILKKISHMLHGAGICTPTFARTKSPSSVGKYTIHGAYRYCMVLLGLINIKDGLASNKHVVLTIKHRGLTLAEAS